MSLYTDLGGEQAIAAALDLFYEKVLADPELTRFFDGVDVDQLKTRQAAFFSTVLGGPDRYDGRDLRTAHRLPRRRGLDEGRFERFMGHFRSTLAELGVPDGMAAEVMDLTYAGKDEVLDR